MSDDDRLLRIKSLINRDMQSVRGKAPVQPQQVAAEGVLQQRKQQLEAQDLALREKAQQQRQQRQMQHRQHLLAEKAQRAALKEQRQKQEALRLQKEYAERRKIQQQMRTTVPSPQEARVEKNLKQEKTPKEIRSATRRATCWSSQIWRDRDHRPNNGRLSRARMQGFTALLRTQNPSLLLRNEASFAAWLRECSTF